MDFFRRIFSRSSGEEGDAAPAAPSTPSAPSSSASEVGKQSNDIMGADTVPVNPNASAPLSEPARVMDGVTRPLPAEKTVMSKNAKLTFGQASDVGMVRTNNQDSSLCFYFTSSSVDERPDFGLFVVADGMGGHHDGEKASALATRVVANQLNQSIYMAMLSDDESIDRPPMTEAMVTAVQKANSEVIHYVQDGGTTLTALAVIGDLAYLAHVGDSRAYLVTKDGVEKLTRDHSLVQRLVELDQLTPDETSDHPQKNVLYRALGQNEALEVDTLTRRLPPNSRVLLCSDGLWGLIKDREIMDIVMNHSNPQEACDKLVALANTRGGLDNITAVIIRIPS